MSTDIRAQLEEERRLIGEATDGPWEIQQGTPTMAGNTWTLRVQGKPGIRIGAHEYQHGAGNSDFITHARTALPVRNAQVEAVLALHKPRIEEVISWACAYGECSHQANSGDTQECPTEDFAICEGCEALAREVNPDYGEDGVQEIAHPCPTVRAIEEAGR